MRAPASTEWRPGSLVRARGRDWMILPTDETGVTRLRPIDGAEEDAIVEERELAAELIGEGEQRRLMLFEAAEGGIGVCEQLLEASGFAQAARRALELCHYDANGTDTASERCTAACYECLLAYENQPVHHLLDRRVVRGILLRLAGSRVESAGQDESRDAKYRRLCASSVDPASDLERGFLDFLYDRGLRLPDRTQHRPSADVHIQADFYYDDAHACVFVDGAVHEQLSTKEADRAGREALADRGYQVVEVRGSFEETVRNRPDIFGSVEPIRARQVTR